MPPRSPGDWRGQPYLRPRRARERGLLSPYGWIAAVFLAAGLAIPILNWVLA